LAARVKVIFKSCMVPFLYGLILFCSGTGCNETENKRAADKVPHQNHPHLDSLLKNHDWSPFPTRANKAIISELDSLGPEALLYIQQYLKHDSTYNTPLYLNRYVRQHIGQHGNILNFTTKPLDQELYRNVILSLGIYGQTEQLESIATTYHEQGYELKKAIIRGFGFIGNSDAAWQLLLLKEEEKDLVLRQWINETLLQLEEEINTDYIQYSKGIPSVYQYQIPYQKEALNSLIKTMLEQPETRICFSENNEPDGDCWIKADDPIVIEDIQMMKHSFNGNEVKFHSFESDYAWYTIVEREGIVMAVIKGMDYTPEITFFDFDRDGVEEIVAEHNYGANGSSTEIYSLTNDSLTLLFSCTEPFGIDSSNHWAQQFILPYQYIDNDLGSHFGLYPIQYKLQNDTFQRIEDPFINALYYLERSIDYCSRFQQLAIKHLLLKLEQQPKHRPSLAALAYIYATINDKASAFHYYNRLTALPKGPYLDFNLPWDHLEHLFYMLED
jgi:hypothetical protein